MLETAPRLQARQGVALSEQLQAGLKLLQMSGAELAQELAAMLDSNPLLETLPGDGGSLPGSDAEDGDGDGAGRVEPLHWAGVGHGRGGEAADLLAATPAPVSLREHLQAQLAAAGLSDLEAAIAELIVAALDDDGYLRDTPRELLASLSAPADFGEEFDVCYPVALRFVQSLEPAGVAARSVAECLALQLDRQPAGAAGRALARRIVADCLALLASNDSAELMRRLDCSERELAIARALIQQLSPRPAQAFDGRAVHYVVPDVIIRGRPGDWQVVTNPDASPSLRLHRAYAQIVRGRRGWSNTALGAQLNEARWLLRSLRQRSDTITVVAQAIVMTQARWLEEGDIAIQPLLLRDIAEATGLHESTVSRVTQGKYMATPRGIVAFRHFFGSRLVSGDGGRMSPQAVQILIRDIVAAENPSEPLSDIALGKALARRGARIARRTVTKYRNEIGIPPVEARRLDALGRN